MRPSYAKTGDVRRKTPLKLRITYREGMAFGGVGNVGVGITNPTSERLYSVFPLKNGYAKNGLAVRILILSRLFFLTSLPSEVLSEQIF